jgi:hypothetical protein
MEVLADGIVVVAALILLAKLFIWPAKKLVRKAEDAVQEIAKNDDEKNKERKNARRG